MIWLPVGNSPAFLASDLSLRFAHLSWERESCYSCGRENLVSSNERLPAEDPDEKLLREVQEKARRIVESNREQMETAQFIDDLAGKVNDLRIYCPSIYSRDQFLYLNILLDQYPHTAMAQITSSLSSTSLTLGSAAFLEIGEEYLTTFGECKKTDEQLAASGLWLTVTRKADEAALSAVMRRFGLDKSPKGQESPLSFLETAMATFRRPPLQEGAAASSMLPMRSAIEQTVLSLFERKPTQEPAGNWELKLRVIAKQTRLDHISGLTVDSWVQQLLWLLDNLSSAKEKRSTRDICESRLRRAMLFIRELLEGLNPGKAKKITPGFLLWW